MKKRIVGYSVLLTIIMMFTSCTSNYQAFAKVEDNKIIVSSTGDVYLNKLTATVEEQGRTYEITREGVIVKDNLIITAEDLLPNYFNVDVKIISVEIEQAKTRPGEIMIYCLLDTISLTSIICSIVFMIKSYKYKKKMNKK